MKRIFVIMVAILLLLTFASCDQNTGGDDKSKDAQYRVALVVPDGVTVKSQNPLTVARGADAVFDIELESTVAYRGASAGEFDQETGKLTIKNVTQAMRVEIYAEDVGYDTTAKYNFSFIATAKDTASVKSGEVNAGTMITLKAGDIGKTFLGWTFGGYLGVGDLLSEDREYSFAITGALTINNYCTIYANYADFNLVYYNSNGGEIDITTQNMLGSDYYSVKLKASDTLEVKYSSEYFELIGAASTFWDDGSFTRDGYILKEYNTKPDGSGEGYSLGSKYPISHGATLYCIWAEESSASDFAYVDISISRPSGVSSAKAPHWIENGIKITGYSGNDTTLVIPDKIDGKSVIAIGTGAFKNKDFETLVMGRHILMVQDGAFTGCDSLTTFHYPDGIYYISNSCFDDATYSAFKNFYVNATIAPRYSASEGGCFAKKLTRLMANEDKNRIIVISGSSSYCGLSTDLLEALIDNDNFCVVNFGTTRTTHIYMYLEAMKDFAHEGDVILYAPENSVYEWGEPRLYWKTIRDLEGMYNIFRGVDISNYENIFGAFAEINAGSGPDAYDTLSSGRYARSPRAYEELINSGSFDEYGEYNNKLMGGFCDEINAGTYKEYYEITLNERVKSILEGKFESADIKNEDWRSSEKWCSATDSVYLRNMNSAINSARSSGAKVYFTFAPVDANAVTSEAQDSIASWCDAYEEFISESYSFDGILGETESYIFNHKYFYNNAFHTNNYGRTYRTYAMYLDLAELLGISDLKDIPEVISQSDNCLLEDGALRGPLVEVEYIN